MDSFSAWRTATGRDQNSIVVNPQFVDAANGNYCLSAGSPARIAGLTGGPVGAYITGNEVIGIHAGSDISDVIPPSPPSEIIVR